MTSNPYLRIDKTCLMKYHILKSLLLLIIMSSCYVQHPRYVSLETAKSVELGMTYTEVINLMSMPPYDLVSKDTLGYTSYIYKYRVKDVKRIPIIMKKNKGLITEGPFRDLKLTFNQNEKLIDIQGGYEEQPSEYRREKVDVNALIASVTTIVTVTIPAILLYIAR